MAFQPDVTRYLIAHASHTTKISRQQRAECKRAFFKWIVKYIHLAMQSHPTKMDPFFKTALEICTSAISLTAHQTHKHDLGDGW